MEILHLLRLPGVPHVEKEQEEEQEEQGMETKEELLEDGKYNEEVKRQMEEAEGHGEEKIV